jgi:hypothetical protein
MKWWIEAPDEFLARRGTMPEIAFGIHSHSCDREHSIRTIIDSLVTPMRTGMSALHNRFVLIERNKNFHDPGISRDRAQSANLLAIGGNSLATFQLRSSLCALNPLLFMVSPLWPAFGTNSASERIKEACVLF